MSIHEDGTVIDVFYMPSHNGKIQYVKQRPMVWVKGPVEGLGEAIDRR